MFRWLLSAVHDAVTAEVSTTEAAGLANAVGSTAVSFDRGLLPRTTAHQAGVTGLWGVIAYQLTATTQAFTEAGVRRLGGDALSTPHRRRAAVMAANVAVGAVGIAMQRGLPQYPEEPLRRAGTRAAGWRITMASVSGFAALAVDGVHDTVTNNHHERQVNALTTVVAGAAVASGMIVWRRRRAVAAGMVRDQYGAEVGAQVRPARAVVVGAGVATGLFVVSRGERQAAHGIAAVVRRATPGLAPYSRAIGHATMLSVVGAGAWRGLGAIKHRTEDAGEAVEQAYATKPDSPYVSGGPNSNEDAMTFGREGRRYVNMALSADEISAVTGRPAIDPIRAFVGLDSDVSPNSRAFRAMDELERLGGFGRSVLAVFFPTGTGYVNYVAAESLEYFTDGDVASVAIQYSVRPSFLSLDEVGTAWESNLSFLTALAWRLRAMPESERPRVVLFGESLGSQGGQDVFAKEGTKGFDLLGVDSALFIGTPFASKWRQSWLARPQEVDPDGIVVEVEGIEAFRRLPSTRRERARIVLLTHERDPIPKFGAPLIIQQPSWLGPPSTRPPGVPKEIMYIPGVTFLHTAVDLLNAEHVKPGEFEAYGHDYRKDIAEMVRAAYRLKVPYEVVERVEKALRERELQWAVKRGEAAAKVEASVREGLEGLGVDTSSVPSLTTPQREVAPDPFAAVPQ